jgi:replication factor C subunit 3/5
MALLVDKHRPRSLDALSYHPELSDRLKALVKLPTCTRKIEKL